MNAAEIIREQGIVAIVREATAQRAAEAVAAIVAGGIRAVEVSLVTPDAFSVIAAAAESAPPGVAIGVGTVMTPAEVAEAVVAGAQFIVSPTLDEAVVRATKEAGLVSSPGVLTPSEAVRAIGWGADFAKLFPATLWSPGSLRDLLAALPALPTIPTGGVTVASAPEWIAAGAVAVGVGSTLTRAEDPVAAAQALIAAVAAARA